ncbi:MAG: LysM peptidoglycan-binding domain-containing protein [Pseudolysinimonas sp.]|uniref:LysM peptidoglycan-binding domain-containing protein n=1 Tax=Pseudolysinimonas sp. TaxID=2680009 RepID=UPI0032657859
MIDTFEADESALPVFPGIAPTPVTGARHLADRQPSLLGKGFRMTLPFVVASAMTVGLNLTGPISPASAAPKKPAKSKVDLSTLRSLVAAAQSETSAAPTTNYTVKAGDTVASIAVLHGIPTASVLALNGLGWKSLIFPGQVLKLSAGTPTVAVPVAQVGGRYTILAGETVSRIAAKFGVTAEAILNANGLGWSSIIYPGQTIAIPAAPAAPEAPAAAPAIENVSSVTRAPAAPAPPAAPSAPSAPGGNYVIASGDTISSIAGRFGVSTQAVLDANGLTSSSIIYPGRTLVIPSPGSTAPASAGGSTGGVTTLSSEQEGNARIIIQVGRQLGIPDYGIVIALATAMQESSLRNINYGDRDSVGLFQQRPSTGWGSVDDIMDPSHAAALFYDGRSGYTRGLRDIGGWESMALTVAAQRVQVSAYPNAYAKWEASARAWFAAFA